MNIPYYELKPNVNYGWQILIKFEVTMRIIKKYMTEKNFTSSLNYIFRKRSTREKGEISPCLSNRDSFD